MPQKQEGFEVENYIDEILKKYEWRNKEHHASTPQAVLADVKLLVAEIKKLRQFVICSKCAEGQGGWGNGEGKWCSVFMEPIKNTDKRGCTQGVPI